MSNRTELLEIIDLINQQKHKYVDRITKLEQELACVQSNNINQELEDAYNKLVSRNNEIKIAYCDLERDNNNLLVEFNKCKKENFEKNEQIQKLQNELNQFKKENADAISQIRTVFADSEKQPDQHNEKKSGFNINTRHNIDLKNLYDSDSDLHSEPDTNSQCSLHNKQTTNQHSLPNKPNTALDFNTLFTDLFSAFQPARPTPSNVSNIPPARPPPSNVSNVSNTQPARPSPSNVSNVSNVPPARPSPSNVSNTSNIPPTRPPPSNTSNTQSVYPVGATYAVQPVCPVRPPPSNTQPVYPVGATYAARPVRPLSSSTRPVRPSSSNVPFAMSSVHSAPSDVIFCAQTTQ